MSHRRGIRNHGGRDPADLPGVRCDGAFGSLDEAARTRDLLFVSLPTHGLFDAHRDDPRCGSFLRRHRIERIAAP